MPIVARAQERESTRRIGVLDTLAADDPEAPIRFGRSAPETGKE